MADLNVTGMSCSHCIAAVTDAVHGVDPTATVHVDLVSGRVTAEGGIASPAALAAAVTDAGYEATPA